MRKKYVFLIIVFLTVASLTTFGPILGNDFINLDDEVYLTKNPYIQSGLDVQTVKWAFTAIVSSNWHPLTLLSHALDWSLFKGHAGGHHFVNLLLHIGCGLLLFFFFHRTTKALWPSAILTAFFVLHPLRVESVAWAAERKDVLSMFLGLASLYVYALYVEKRTISLYCFCLFLFVLSLMAKPMLLTLPFVFLLLDYWPLARWLRKVPLAKDNVERPGKKKIKRDLCATVVSVIPGLTRNPGNYYQYWIPACSGITNLSGLFGFSKVSKKQKQADKPVPGGKQFIRQNTGSLIGEKTPFFVFTAISSVLTIWAQNKGGAVAYLHNIPLFERISNAVVSYVAYLGKIFWPVDLAVFYPYSHTLPAWQVLGAVFILLTVSITAVLLMKKAPYFLVGWLWYLGTLVPVIGLVQVGRQAMADRYTYLPSIGLGIMLVWSAYCLLPREKIRKIIFIPAISIILIALIITTWRQCGYWKNSLVLFNHALMATEKNYLAHANLGVALAAAGRNDEAAFHYREAIRIDAYQDNAHYNLANLLARQGRIEEAISNYREALRINPNYFNAYINLGVNLARLQKYDDAIFYYQQAVQIRPGEPGVYLNLGVALANKGQLQEAIKHFRMALYLNPDYADARQALKLALELARQR